MKNSCTSKSCNVAALAAVVFVLSTAPAYAYVDPGSASIVITAILGAIAAVGYTFRSYMEKVKAFFRRADANQDAERD